MLKDELLESEPLQDKMLAAAYHEAGHIVVAAACGLRLRAKGIVLDDGAQGIACYCFDPKGSDDLRQRIVVATYSGFYAEQECRRIRNFRLRQECWGCSEDGQYAEKLVYQMSFEYLVDGDHSLTEEARKKEAREAVVRNWAAITEIAEAVLSKESGPIQEIWSKEASGKELPGNEIVRLLETLRIPATCVSEC